MSFECASKMSQQNMAIKYSPAIQRLLKEHGPLRDQMASYHKLAVEIKNSNDENTDERLKELHAELVTFIEELDPHSQREEDYLFTAMEKYIGRTSGPLVVMEYEHEQAKKNLPMFIEKYESSNFPINTELASVLTQYAIESYHILINHFMKEENVLFPMAETFLSDEEKEELAKKFDSVI
ncbi:hemerythrin domain-containing protein [Bacillus sp. Marseille-P3661]|uniref:hemerythrin domain-containing protein n=1 Tax=Bacillus sp. Marseille-P3661 TaxID=1936234 RepID=UPI00215531F6|nr:hemerythrin domain-containing protein [Bacillus sp. Marseille-P3661]